MCTRMCTKFRLLVCVSDGMVMVNLWPVGGGEYSPNFKVGCEKPDPVPYLEKA